MTTEAKRLAELAAKNAEKARWKQLSKPQQAKLRNMIYGSRKRGLKTPSRAAILDMIPSDMICPGCKREMVWNTRIDGSRVMSLQHDRSGSLRIICRACNTRHAFMPGDLLYDIGSDERWCPDCKSIKPLIEFHKDNTRALKASTYCKPCSLVRSERWRKSNLPRVAATARNFRARKAAIRAAMKEQDGE